MAAMTLGEQALNDVLMHTHKGVLALDPGGTTGCAWIEVNSYGTDAISYCMVSDRDTISWLDKFLKNNSGSIGTVVIEKHVPRIGVTMGREARETMELIGGCAAVATGNGCEVAWHTASQMKTVPWCHVGRGVHAKDAAKHLARFMLDDAGNMGLIEL